MLEKVITKVGGIENVNLAMLGQLAKAFTSSEMAQFSADMIADGIDQLVAAYDDMDQSTRRTIYDKVLAYDVLSWLHVEDIYLIAKK